MREIVEGPGGAETERGRAVRTTGGVLVVASQIKVIFSAVAGAAKSAG